MNNNIQFKRTVTLYLMGFLLIFGYAFARPCIDSIFLEHYSSDMLPSAWLLTALCSVFVIAFYNRFNQKYSILSLYGYVSLICAVLLAILLTAYLGGLVPAIFILYVWKELYMVVLIETYWSFADIVFSVNSARHTYGLAMAFSSLGGIIGNLSVGPLARMFGSSVALGALIVLLILGFIITYCARSISDAKPSSNKTPDLSLGLKTMVASKYLILLGVLVCTVQVVIGLIDYRFNTMLQEHYVNTDMRTQILGNLHAAVNLVGISIQLCTGPILKIFGLGLSFKSIPFLLSAAILAFILVPHFWMMLVVKIFSKAFDYSLFRGAKEILYIPLTREEKTQGKGIIDIFMYRMARGFSSLLLMLMIALGISVYVIELSLVLVALWLVLALIIIRRYQALIAAK